MKTLLILLFGILLFSSCSNQDPTQNCNVYQLEYSTVLQAEKQLAADTTVSHIIVKQGDYEYLITTHKDEMILVRKYNLANDIGFGILLGIIITIGIGVVISIIIE